MGEIISQPMNSQKLTHRSFLPLVVIVAVSTTIFLPHLVGWGQFVGDSDRVSHSLTAFAAFLDGFKHGKLHLWNETVFGGYSLVALPYYYPNPIIAIAAWLGVEDVYRFAGWESFVLHLLSGATAYAFLRGSGRSLVGACTGAVLYQTCALTIEKISQNDLSFIAIILIPVLLGLIRRSARATTPLVYLGLFATTTILLTFTFLQKATYAGLIAGLFVMWLAVEHRSWKLVLFNISAVIPAILISLPRLITVGEEFAEGNRRHSGAKDITSVYEATGFSRIEILRWLDDRIFGANFFDLSHLHNGLDFHEGFLIYMSAFAPFTLAYLMVRNIPWRQKNSEAIFFVCFFALSFVVVFTATGYWIFWNVFFQIEFIHFRFLVVAMLPCCALIALAIDDLQDRFASTTTHHAHYIHLLVIIGAFASILIIEIFAYLIDNSPSLLSYGALRSLQTGSIFRILASIVLLCGLCWAAQSNVLRRQIYLALAVLMIFQGTAYAVLSVWGPKHWPTPPTYQTATQIMARPGDYRLPSSNAVNDVRERLAASEYRTAFICPKEFLAIPCQTQLANFWRLRSIDGYLGSLPMRLAIMPFGTALSYRVIGFSSLDQINWSLMGLLNVRYALMYSPALFANAVREEGGHVREILAKELTIVENPLPVTPRVFFVRTAIRASDMSAAAQELFPNNQVSDGGYAATQQSVVEGLKSDRTFPDEGTLAAQFDWDHVTIEISPSKQERFLVLNELYDRMWKARDETGYELHIYPTNVMMRGIIVPPNISRVIFTYEPFMAKPAAIAFYISGLFCLILGFFALTFSLRITQQRSSPSSKVT